MKMKKTILFLVAGALAITLFSCGKGTTTAVIMSANPTEVVATVNGANITNADLDIAIKGRLQRVDQEIYEIKKGALSELVETTLIDEAAKKQGKSADDYMKENIEDKVSAPTDEEIKKFYDQRKEQMGGKSFKDAEGQIKAYLEQSRKQAMRAQLLNGLKASGNVKVLLSPPRIEVEAGDNPSIGPKSAPITIIEFTDYQCPFCSRVRPTIKQITEEYKDNVRYVLRDFPLSFHQFAKKAHEAARCAGDQGKYWDYSKELWAHQQALQPDKLKEYAKATKLNMKKFDECLDKGKYTKVVEENVAYGASVGAQGTPSFFINGIFFSGARPYADFKVIIDQELNK